MIEFIPIIFGVIGLIAVFYMFKALISYIGNESSVIIEEYSANISQISKQLHELNQSSQNQAKAIATELQQASYHYSQSVAYIVQEFDKLSEELRKIKESIGRQKELEAEIVRLKSILARKEKQNVSE